MAPPQAGAAATPPARLSTNIAVSIGNVLAVVGSSLLALPLLVGRLGLEAYGVWVLAQTLVIYVTTAENGFGPAIARFTSLGAHARDGVLPLLALALGAYVTVGFLVVGGAQLFADPVVRAFDVPPELREDAAATVRIVGWVTVAALASSALGHTLSGLERFAAFTATNVVGSVIWLGMLLLTLDPADPRLTDVGYAALVQWTAVAVLRLAMVRDVMRSRGRVLPDRRLIRDVVVFSAPLQVAILATLLNTQTDRVVVAAVASAATLGQVGIATQVADAGRFLVSAGFPPLASRMAASYGRDGFAALDATLAATRRTWQVAILGVVAIGAGAIVPAVGAWLGEGYDRAAGYGIALLVAYGLGWLPGPAFAYLRAIGRPRLEGQFGVLTVVVNVAATIPFGILFGATGVIAATLFAYLSTTGWVLLRARRILPPAPTNRRQLPTAIAVATAAAAAYGGASVLLTTLPGAVALVAIGILCCATFVAYLSVSLGVMPAEGWRRIRRMAG